jgi:serine/threonine protein kinase
LAQVLEENDAEVSCFIGTYMYCSPEQGMYQRGTQKSDVFSLGASSLHLAVVGTKWEVEFGKGFAERKYNREYLSTARKAIPELYPAMWERMMPFFEKTLAADPKKRATSEELVVRGTPLILVGPFGPNPHVDFRLFQELLRSRRFGSDCSAIKYYFEHSILKAFHSNKTKAKLAEKLATPSIATSIFSAGISADLSKSSVYVVAHKSLEKLMGDAYAPLTEADALKLAVRARHAFAHLVQSVTKLSIEEQQSPEALQKGNWTLEPFDSLVSVTSLTRQVSLLQVKLPRAPEILASALKALGLQAVAAIDMFAMLDMFLQTNRLTPPQSLEMLNPDTEDDEEKVRFRSRDSSSICELTP